MSRLLFIRHGQASFLADDYDRLSELGQHQARLLGQHAADSGIVYDAFYAGPRVRQSGTAKLMCDSIRAAGQACPTPQTLPEMDEHQVDQLILRHLPRILEQAPRLRSLADAFVEMGDPGERGRQFQRLFEAVSNEWMAGTLSGVEAFGEFADRVNAGIDRLIAAAKGGQIIAVCTSVGPISIAIQRALRCTDQVAVETGWRIRNCSLTEFVFSGSRFTLDSFNRTPHLSPELLTFR